VQANLLGQGSFGKVYQGMYEEMPVAIKLIHDDVIESEKASLLKECKIMTQLHHHHICRIYGFNLNKGSAFMVMELARLGSLYTILRDKKKHPHLPWKLRLSIAMDILRGMGYMHKRHIIHRDLKSLNVLLRQDWSAIICDFGLARIKLTSQSVGTKGVGSASWMAPEMGDRDQVTTAAVDIFSFGMIMYELLTREVPFGIEKLSGTQIAIELFRGKRPMIGDQNKYESMKDCPRGYTELMTECWRQDPTKRPQCDKILSQLHAMAEEIKDSGTSSLPQVDKAEITKERQLLSDISTDSSLITMPFMSEEKKNVEVKKQPAEEVSLNVSSNDVIYSRGVIDSGRGVRRGAQRGVARGARSAGRGRGGNVPAQPVNPQVLSISEGYSSMDMIFSRGGQQPAPPPPSVAPSPYGGNVTTFIESNNNVLNNNSDLNSTTFYRSDQNVIDNRY